MIHASALKTSQHLKPIGGRYQRCKPQINIDTVLTNREKEVLELISYGFSTKEISGKLYIGCETIKTYRANLLHKLNCTNMAGMVRKAFEIGLLHL